MSTLSAENDVKTADIDLKLLKIKQLEMPVMMDQTIS